jgi:hypothetical protein
MTDQSQSPQPVTPAPAGTAGSSSAAGSSAAAGSSSGAASERAWTLPSEDAHGQTGATSPADGSGPADADGGGLADALVSKANERPELAAGAAFAGGLILAMILKRFAD